MDELYKMYSFTTDKSSYYIIWNVDFTGILLDDELNTLERCIVKLDILSFIVYIICL